MLAMHFVIYYL